MSNPDSQEVVDALVVKNAAELVEELLKTVGEEGAKPWFVIIERKMKRLAEQLRQ